MHRSVPVRSCLRVLAAAAVLTLGALALTGCPPSDPNAACPPGTTGCASGDTCNALQVSAGRNGTCAVVGPTKQCRDLTGTLSPAPASGDCAAGSTLIYVGSEVRCWGQLNSPVTAPGASTEITQNNTPTTMPLVSPRGGAQPVSLYRQVVVGPNGNTCVVDIGGQVQCWGARATGFSVERYRPDSPWRLEGYAIANGTNPFDVSTVRNVVATEVALGDEHGCALVNGTPVCWGVNGAGALAEAPFIASEASAVLNSPRGTFTGVIHLVAGAEHSCGLMADGTVRCWSTVASEAVLGFAGRGELANQVLYPADAPSGVRRPLENVRALSAGGTHTCAIVEATNSERSVYCWGTNASRELGVADLNATTATVATSIPGSATIRQVAAGRSHTCVLAAGRVACWGANTSGQCGVAVSPTVGFTPVLGISDAVELTAGNDHTCVRLRSGEIRCWGGNEQGQLGLRTNVSPLPTPPTSGALCCQPGTGACASGCADLQTDNLNCGTCGRACASGDKCVSGQCLPAPSCGACVIARCSTPLEACRADMSCKTWFECHEACVDDACRGRCMNASTALAAAVTTCQASLCEGACRGRRLAAGADHTCAIRRSAVRSADEVVCWGDNEQSQLGVADAGRCGAVPGLTDAVEVVAGDGFSCARRASGEVRCRGVPTDGFGMPTINNVVELAAGKLHVCARFADGTVRCWGTAFSDDRGLLGHPPGSPGPVTGLTGVVEIAAGVFHTCARLANGTVQCWGVAGDAENGSDGRLGSEGEMTSTPRAVTGLSGVAQITAGTNHTCARLTGGEVRCWGANESGQLGRAGEGGPTPMPVAGLMGVVEIAAGYHHTCAITGADRNVSCWGAALGPEGTTGGATPRPVLGAAGMPLRDAVEISVGRNSDGGHACARLRDGNVWCWGANGDGRLGVATTTAASATAVQSVCTPGCATTAAAMMPAAATTTTCGLTCVDTNTDANHCGQCDHACTDGLTCEGGRCAQAPTMCMDPTTLCGGGADARCVDLQTDPANCRECGAACRPGQLCNRGRCVEGTPTRLAAGVDHSCQVVNGAVRCWGSDSNSQRGDGPTTSSQVCSGPALTGVVEIAAGNDHTCALLEGGEVRCWGRNEFGQLGDGSTVIRTAPVAVVVPSAMGGAPTNLTGVAQITAGWVHTCARLASGEVRCWGAGGAGRLGNGSAASQTTPVAVVVPSAVGGASTNLTGVVEIAAGGEGTCARLASGEVRCWGANSQGQLGDGSSTDRLTPVAVVVPAAMGGARTNLTGVVELAAGGRHTCARLASGEVQCWGRNSNGQLGNGATEGRQTPVAVVVPSAMGGAPTNLSGVVGITAGFFHTCARLASGEVRCWGRNSRGQLADGSAQGRTTPVAVVVASVMGGATTNLTGVVEIAAGNDHTCARLQNGEVRCWGENVLGQLGNAPRTAGRYTPSFSTTPLVATCTAANTSCAMGTTACGTNCCTTGQTCESGTTCVTSMPSCMTGLTTCPGAGCVNLQTDQNHCGSCSTVCSTSQMCERGTCTANPMCRRDADCADDQRCDMGVCIAISVTCTAPQQNCRGTCVNTQTDNSNCGMCGSVCSLANAIGSCRAGVCAIGSCLAGFADCDMNPANGCEANTGTDRLNCGMCGRTCPVGQVCAGGVCGTTCMAPTPTLCGTTCVNTQTDPDHCGACPTVCPTGMNAARSCASGLCGLLCNANFGNCDGMAANGCEIDTRTSLAHCGACGRACATPPNGTAACAGGTCGIASCNAGFGNCDGSATNGCEVNTNTDPARCGSCTTVCPVPSNGTATCAAGTCGIACNTGRTNCSGACVDLQTDGTHCGSCATACAAGQVCLAGVCTLSCGTQTNCGGSCVNLNTNTSHCGACGTVCAAPSNGGTVACMAGSCVPSCPSGTHLVGSGSGAACVASGGPHLVAPLSLGDTTQTQPAFRWTNVAGSNGARLEICADRACATVVQTLTASGTTATPVTTATPTAPLTRMTLPARTFFWRATAMVGTTVDAGNTSPVWLFHTPRTNRGTVQTSVRPHLDVNGDGLDDIALGAPAAGSGAGRVDVYLGVSTGLPTAVHRAFAGAATDAFGTSVAPAGDVNGDGFGDLVVGAPGASSGRGAFSLYLGSAAGLGATASVTQPGVAAGDAFARVVVGAGDVDGDGYADLVACAPGATSGSGAAEWFRGAASFASMRGATLTSSGAPGGQFGLTLANAGDIDGDGYSDVVVGEPGYNSSQGRMHVFRGSATGLPPTATRIDGGSVGDRFTEGLAGAGDVNADGFSDVVTSAPLALGGNVGGFNMFVGSATGLSTASVPAGNLSGAGWGRSLAGAGDVDGDGRDDLVIAAPFDASRAGHVYLVSGPALIAAGFFGFPARLFEQTGSAASVALGASVAGLGDVNGDGFADIAFGAPGESADSRGAVFVLRGAMASFTPPATTFVTATVTGDRLGAAIASPDAIVPSAAPACSPATQTRCGGACVDLLTSVTNCGACGNACASGQTCAAGVCGGGMSCTPGTQCRAAAAGGCDVAETCDPSGACPVDGFVVASVQCRAAAAGGCDVAETCTGASAACPADGFQPATTVCRAAAAGGCDVAETCTGRGAACPADGFRPSTFVCAAADTATCLAAATCTGSGAACPTRATTCASGETCTAGVCVGGCGTGTTACGSGCCTASQTCLSSLCRVLNLASGAPTTQVGDTATGTDLTAFGSPAFDCPAGMVLTDLNGILTANFGPPSGNFRSLWGTCRPVLLGSGPTISLGSATVTATAGRAASSMGFPFTTGCLSGQAAIGVDVSLGSEGYPAAIRLRCAPLTATMSGAGFVVGRGPTVTPSEWVGPDVMFGGPPSMSTEADCTGANAFAAGIAGVTFDDGAFTGARNNAFGVGCRTATIAP